MKALNELIEVLNDFCRSTRDCFDRQEKRIDKLEAEIAALKREPRKSFGQKLKERK